MRIEQVHKELLEKFRKLYSSEDEYKRAYASYCDEAYAAKMALRETDEYDEFTEMVRI